MPHISAEATYPERKVWHVYAIAFWRYRPSKDGTSKKIAKIGQKCDFKNMRLNLPKRLRIDTVLSHDIDLDHCFQKNI